MSMNDMMKEVEKALGGKAAELRKSADAHEASGQPYKAERLREAAAEMEAPKEKTRGNGYDGRGPTGRLRNYKQMDDDKLIRTYEAIKSGMCTGKEDPEALGAYEAELRYRSWLQGQWEPLGELPRL